MNLRWRRCGLPHESHTFFCRCVFHTYTVVYLLRLIPSSGVFRTFWSKKRVRTENPLRSIKKIKKFYWKRKKLEQLKVGIWKKFEIENFRKFSMSKFFISIQIPMTFFENFSKNFDLKNFQMPTLSCSNFFRFQ